MSDQHFLNFLIAPEPIQMTATETAFVDLIAEYQQTLIDRDFYGYLLPAKAFDDSRRTDHPAETPVGKNE